MSMPMVTWSVSTNLILARYNETKEEYLCFNKKVKYDNDNLGWFSRLNLKIENR
jgi:hypothetical protein